MNIRSSSTAPAPIYPGDPPRRSRTTLLVVVFTLVALAAAAVVVVNLTKDDDGRVATATNRQEAPAASTPTTAADPQAATKAAIVAAYRQSFDAFVAVGSDPRGSPDDPRLSQHTIGNALLASQITIKRLRDAGQVYAGRVEVHPTVVELTADTAVVADCGVGDLAVVEVATGRVVKPAGPPVGAASTATYRLIDGKWMQNSFKDEKRSCEPAPGS
jgi:hypothetical protein